MSLRRLFILLLLPAVNPALAQWWDDAEILTHPRFPETRPFVFEVHGVWNSACNPSAAEPVITHFDGESLEIDFELDECPPTLSVPYPYRVLVDIGPAFTGNETYSPNLDVTLRFGDEIFTDTILISGSLASPPLVSPQVFPEPGLYQAYGHEKQGLLLARQGAALAVYPLVYDENGSAEWLFAGGTIGGNAYFAPLYQASGGQCLGCPPPAEPPSLDPIGDVTMVFDTPGVLQMQIDDGDFVEYRQLNYGRAIRGAELPDLDGYWALLDSRRGSAADETVAPRDALPGVFRVQFEELGEETPVPLAHYLLRDLAGAIVGELACETEALVPPPFSWQFFPLTCELGINGEDDASIRYAATLVALDRLELTAVEPLPDGVAPPRGVIVRARP